jgi:hypothetical protein
MSTKPCRLAVGALAILLCSGSAIGDTLWLSDKSPHAGHGGGHSHGGPVEVRRGVYYKHLWLRHGTTPADSGYLVQGTKFSPLILMDTKGEIKELKVKRGKLHGMLNVEFPMPDEGFYNAYLSHTWINQGTRQIQIAKSEVLKHSCREGHDHVQEKMPPKHNAAIPLEIVRNRFAHENFHSKLGYGDDITFTILHNGKPQPRAEVTISTSQGWSNKKTSDSKGQVSFKMIRDYYPPWKLFQKRYSQPYMVSADYQTAEAGDADGQHFDTTLYRASFSGNYYPSESDYQSYAYGLIIGTFALVFSGLAVYLYRRRRNRPYREVRFDE